MGSTQYNQIPYPELTDPPDGPAQMKALADRVDQLLHTGVPTVQAGQFTGGPNNAVSYSTSVTFPRAFSTAPTVVTNINSGSGSVNTSSPRAFGISATAFTYNIFATATVTYSVPLQWAAVLSATVPVAVTRTEDGWHYVTATCHTAQCPKDGQPVEGIMVPDDPAAWGWTGIICGACGQPITDIVPT